MKSIRRISSDVWFDAIVYSVLAVAALAVAYPLFFIVIASISDPLLVGNGKVLFIPKGITFEAYRTILEYDEIWMGYRNTILYTAVGTTINVVLTLMTAYPLSRKDLKGGGAVMLLFTFTMFFNGGLIPTYLLMLKLGLVNNFWIMVLMGAVNIYNVILTRTFFQHNIPQELYESAILDGCSDIKFFTRIVIPLSGAMVAVLAIFYAVAHWNEFFRALIYLNDRKLQPLQLILREILAGQQSSSRMEIIDDNDIARMMLAESIKYGVIIISSIPVLLMYPFAQRHFVKGIMIGAIKG